MWGTLSCTLIVRDEIAASHAEALNGFIDGARYGTVALNTWTASSYTQSVGTWGAYPGEPLDNVRRHAPHAPTPRPPLAFHN